MSQPEPESLSSDSYHAVWKNAYPTVLIRLEMVRAVELSSEANCQRTPLSPWPSPERLY